MLKKADKAKGQPANEFEQLQHRVTELEREIAKLRQNEIWYTEILDSLQEVVFEVDLAGNLKYGSRSGYAVFGYTEQDFANGINIIDSIVPEERAKFLASVAKLQQGQDLGISEYTAQRRNGSRFPMMVHSSPIIQDNRTLGFRGIVIDISERKALDEQISYLSMHDSLTGFYNRAYFDQAMQRLSDDAYYPVGLIICDLDNLKLVNDVMGHHHGDLLLQTAAEIIRKCFDAGEIITRIGGDEFAILLPQTNRQVIVDCSANLYTAIGVYNDKNPKLPLSMSVGFAMGVDNGKGLDYLFKQADSNMYREKLQHHYHKQNSIVQSFIMVMKARNIITAEQVKRLQDLIEEFAATIGWTEDYFDNLRLFVHYHDIGKTGIPEYIIFKQDELANEESLEMQRHCEIGYRIALASPELIPIAGWILSHHEWWNGHGYPFGLKGEDIPVESRIFAIVDAYDKLMYGCSKTLSPLEALRELLKGAGTQFDPDLVKSFRGLVMQKLAES